MEVTGPTPGPIPERIQPGVMYRKLCAIAAATIDWEQRLVSAEDAMKRINEILDGK